ncbi:MAG: Hsp20/alpha crystallin family protein [Cyanobacteriota bacterium]|jgi:HSP20 family protein|nr:Hsp20/alpha crystallin family protein [Cyanobacteriota bacterium]
MALEKWEPMKGIEEFFDRYGRLVAWPSSRHWGALGDWQPRVDIRETDGTYLIQADIPGVEKNDLKVTLEQGVLTLQGERHQESREDRDRMHRVERVYGSFTRSFTLPADADEAGLKASAKEGQLTIEIPKKAGAATPPAAVQVPVE